MRVMRVCGAFLIFLGGFMARYDGSIRINTQIDTNGIRRGESVVRGSLNRISEAARSTAALLASVFVVKKLIQFGKEAIELGSDLEEVQNVVDVTFTTMSEKVNEFAKNAAVSAGLSETMAKRYVGTFGAMSKSFGFAEDEAYQMSIALTQLSGDVASFYNITQDEAYTKLKSVFTGETETLKDLGVVMTQAALDQYALANGFGKTTSKMTEQEKVALRHRFVMEKLAGASGDFVRTSDSWANQTRILKLQVESLMATIGQGLINIFTPFIKVINILLGKLATVANAFKSFTELITGKKSSDASGGVAGAGIVGGGLGDSIDGYNDAADAADNLAVSTEKVADATKKAEKAAEGYLNPLDEISKFSGNEELAELEEPGAEINLGDISGIENIDYGKVAEGENVLDKVSESAGGLIGKLKELAGIFKQGFFDGLGDWEYRWDSIKDSIASIKESLKDIFTNPEVISAADSFVKSAAYMLGSLVGATASIGLTIATNIVGGIAKYLEENKERIKEHLVSMFNIWEEVNYLLSDLFQSFAYVFEAFASEDGQRLTSNLIGIFVDAFMGVAELASKLIRDILNVFIQPFVENKEAFRTALEGFLGVLASVTGTIKDSIDATFAKLNEVYNKHIKPFFDSVAQGISDLVGKFLEFWNGNVQPILDEWAKKFDILWKEHIQPFINNFIELLGGVFDLLKALWETILQPFIGWIIDNVLPVLLPIVDTLFDALSSAISGIVDLLNYVLQILKDFIGLVTALIKGDWSGAWESAKNIFKDFLDILTSVSTDGLEILKNLFENALNAILSIFKKIFDGIKNHLFSWNKDANRQISDSMLTLKAKISDGLNNIKLIWDNIWNSFINTIRNIWSNITNIVSNAISSIKNMISGVLSLFSSIGSKIGNLFSGNSRTTISGNTSSRFSRAAMPASLYSADTIGTTPIPALARGAVIPANKEFLAVLGDQKHGTNIEAPLTTIEEAVANVMAKINATGGIGGNKDITIRVPIYLDGKVLYEAVINQGKINQMSGGRNGFMLGTT